MISVKKDYNEIPKGLTSKSAENKRITLLKEKNEHDFNGKIYGHDSVKKKLREIYRNKCGYCECSIDEGAYLHIDHYRPKKAVKGVPEHSGYYWLGYEWSNLILCCQKCNNAKSTRFPIAGKRVEGQQDNTSQWVADSESFVSEKPLLLNPEIDEPEKHLVFKGDGSVKEANDSVKGKESISDCGLDLDREELKIARKKMVDGFKRDITKQIERLINMSKDAKLSDKKFSARDFKLAFKTIFENLMQAKEPDSKFSRLGWHMTESFHKFFVMGLPRENQRKVLTIAFESFLNHESAKSKPLKNGRRTTPCPL